MELIERGRLHDLFVDTFCGMELITLNSALDIMDNATTIDAIHAAGGCYCRECKRAVPYGDGFICGEYGGRWPKDGHCSNGKPRETQDDG